MIQTNNIQHDISEEILKRRYLWKDKNGKVIETKEQMFRRVANTIAAVEKKYGATDDTIKAIANGFYEFMAKGIFLPNSPTLMNAGREKGMLSACFVLPIEDSIDGIFDTVKNTALIQKAGGGTGFSFDRLRPTGDIVTSSGGTTSGPISFWKVIAEATNAIQQGAFRRGANMGMINLDHPDILKFIHAKQDLTAFNNFNISVKITDSFMAELIEKPDSVHIVTNPRTKRNYAIPRFIDINSYTIDDLIPQKQANDNCYTVKELWEMIVKNAHATGEPGVCFIDRINEANPTPHLGQIEACNPCGEQPLLPYEACNLGSINISKFILPDGSDIDWPALHDVVEDIVGFLDNVIDANYFPIPEIEKITLGNRKIGLGIMGFADTLVRMGIRYDSEEAVDFAEQLSHFIQKYAHGTSKQLAEIRGAFPTWKGSIWDTKHHQPMRNAAVTTIAPTGSISIIADCNGGIEPIYSLVSKRRALDGQEFIQLHPVIERLGTKQDWLSDKVRDQLANGIPPKDISEIPSQVSYTLVTAHEITPQWHIRIQVAFQKHTDNAVSKTVNLPSTATIDDVDKVLRLAYELNCKGTTVYKDGCRNNQVISAAYKKRTPDPKKITPKPRPRKTKGETTKYTMGCGKLYVSVNKDDQGLCEVFANLGKAGGCQAQSEATCRAVSTALRSGVNPGILVEQLKGIRCLSTITRRKEQSDIDVRSCPDAIARALEEALEGTNVTRQRRYVKRCPECGRILRF
ncbi:MAG: adenosylcobalamin-dependent ribonucleoside-diphosphate reductase, partial [Planctomycetota bacterium]